MAWLSIGLILFFVVHAVPWWPSARNGIVAALGATAYRALFAIVSGVGFVAIVVGFVKAPHVPVYAPPSWGSGAALALMLPAMVLVVAAYVPGNIRRLTPHPMLWGVLLWSLAHLAANGDRASLMLFGSFAMYAVLDMMSANRRGAHKRIEPVPLSRDGVAVITGLIAYAGLLRLHPFLFGVSPLHGG